MSDIFKSMCKLLKIKKINTTAYHPQSNGALERSHKTLVEYLRNFTNLDQSNWYTLIPFAMFCYNTTPHSSTSYMPYELVFGTKPRLPSSLLNNLDTVYNYDNYLSKLKYQLQFTAQHAKKLILNSKEISKAYYDKNANPVNFKPGDLVLIRNEVRKGKLHPLYVGPYKVLNEFSNDNVEIQVNKKKMRVHKNPLQRFNS